MKRTCWLYALWITALVALAALHAIHLRADFPNHSPWMDYSKYTDEGWYGKAAIEHYVRGTWYVHGDFNPSVALPVLPALELALFHFTGVSLTAARLLILAVFAGNLLLTYFIVRVHAPQWTALLAVTLLAANAFLYAFSRLAILEPLLIFFLLASWLLALQWQRAQSLVGKLTLLSGIGLMLCLMVLTKTTAVFVIPSTLFIIWHSCGYKLRLTLRACLPVAAAAGLLWAAYYILFVRPHYGLDYHYLFSANEWTKPANLKEWLLAFWFALHGTLWIDPWLTVLAAMWLILSFTLFRHLWHNPLFAAALLAAGGYIFFIGWHNNMQPRYYQVVAFPLVIIAALALAASTQLRGKFKWPLASVCGALMLISCTANLRLVMQWTTHPEYSWTTAASRLTRYIDTHPNGNRLLLSISGDNITLITHLPAICDDFGTWDLPYRIHYYRPGWYAAWNEIDPGTLQDLQTQYSLEQVAAFPAFDDPDRNQLILYKLHPLPARLQHYDDALEQQAALGK
jgi:4-amino-4-deoxy-L-arabinose transferase-like glycosyltransferase